MRVGIASSVPAVRGSAINRLEFRDDTAGRRVLSHPVLHDDVRVAVGQRPARPDPRPGGHAGQDVGVGAKDPRRAGDRLAQLMSTLPVASNEGWKR